METPSPSLRKKLAVHAANMMNTNSIGGGMVEINLGNFDAEEPKRRGSSNSASASTSTSSLQSTSSHEAYTLGDHEVYLHIRTEKNGLRYCDLSHYLVQSFVPKLVKDYISPLSHDQLLQLYSGIVPTVNDSLDEEPLPVRTLCFRIRPDIESVCVMDVVQSVFEGNQNKNKSVVLKHQGGHFQCAVDHDSAPFFIDAQLCITKSENIERQLVLRIHRVHDCAKEYVDIENNMTTERKAPDEESPRSFPINLHLKEASSLLQLIYSAQKHNTHADADGCVSPRPTPKETSVFLQENYQEKKTVKAEGTAEPVFPALSSKDFSLLQSSLPYLLLIWKGLVHQNCTFDTLVDIPLGTCFDTMYLSQIQQLSRDNMLKELRTVKAEIDKNSQHAEDEYSNFTELLGSPFNHYTIDLPETIPPKVSMMEFPSSECPPGFSIAAATASYDVAVDPANPVSAVDQIARKVYAACSALDDDEQRWHLKILNMETLARCVQIQAHFQELIDRIENPTQPSVVAVPVGFRHFGRKAVNHKGRVKRFLTAKVPLLDLKTGPSFLSVTRMLLLREGVFSKTPLFDLQAVEFEVSSPGCVQVVSDVNGKVLHKFWSSMDANKVKMFMYTLKSLETSQRS
jgi:hypothetical protein